jgi:hypothetical protein
MMPYPRSTGSTRGRGNPRNWIDYRLLVEFELFRRNKQDRALLRGERPPSDTVLLEEFVRPRWPWPICGKNNRSRRARPGVLGRVARAQRAAVKRLFDKWKKYRFEDLPAGEFGSAHIQLANIHIPRFDPNPLPFNNYDCSLPRWPLPARQDGCSTAQPWIGLRLSPGVALTTHRRALVVAASWALVWSSGRLIFWTPRWVFVAI